MKQRKPKERRGGIEKRTMNGEEKKKKEKSCWEL